MDLGLTGKKVIMNGGAHGLGLASLKLVAAEGADVAFFSRKEDKIEAAKAEIEAAGPGKVFAEVFDMATGTNAYQGWPETPVASPRELLAAVYAAAGAHDRATVESLTHPDFVLYEANSLPFADE